mgnify:CR=1 FL=1
MLKKIGAILIIVVFLLVSIGIVMAEGKGNARKGKYLFRKNCRTCHVEGGTAKPLSPIDKTQAEWEAIFTSKDYAQFGCKEEWNNLNDTQVTDIYTYLFEHASDSPTPAKCK